jgi:dihydroneopterin aldolase
MGLNFRGTKIDKIIIEGLRVESLIGVYQYERDHPQPLEINMSLWLDLSLAGKSDRLSDTIDYDAVGQLLAEVASNSQFQLVEALAEAMASRLKAEFNVHKVVLGISKPGIIENASSVYVEIER